MRTPLRTAERLALAALLVLATATCTDQPTEPGGGHAAQVRFTPVFPVNTFAQGLPLDNVTVTVVRPDAETLAVVNAPFDVADSVLQLAVPVTLLAPNEDLEVTIDLLSGVSILFRGRDTIPVTSGTGTPAPAITMQYVGPGANIAFLAITPADTVLSFGDSLVYGAQASDALENPVTTFYLRWSTGTPGRTIRSDGLLVAPAVRATVEIIAWTPSGIQDTTSVTFIPVPTQLLKIGGDLQSDTAGDTLSAAFVVEVRAADNLPVQGVAVAFAAVTAGGAVVTSGGVTDSLGRAGTFGVLGDTARTYSYSATIAGVAPVTFQATANAGPAALIAKVSGDVQSDTSGQVLPLPLVVRVADASDNPVAGAAVVWTRVFGSGTPSADTVLTDGSGNAQVAYTLGAPGTDSISAQIAGTGATVTFSATAVAGGIQVVAVAGDSQIDTVARLLADSLVVETQALGSGTPVGGVQVVWVVQGGNGVLSADTVVSDSLGRAAVMLTLGTVAGEVEVLVDAFQGGPLGVFHLQATADSPHHLGYFVTPPDTVVSGAILIPAPVVQVRDSFDNVIQQAGVVIHALTDGMVVFAPPARTTPAGLQFVAYAGGVDSALTDSTGHATFDSLVIAGDIGAENLHFETLVAGIAPVQSPIYVLAGAPTDVVALQGDSQTVFVDSFVPILPRVAVTDSVGNPIAGVTVDWVVVQGGGQVTGATSLTDSAGEAEVGSWQLGPSPGPNALRAIVGGVDSVVFTANGQPLTPTIMLTLLNTNVVGVGRTATLKVALSSPDTAGVVVTLTNLNPGVVTLDTASATFGPVDTARFRVLTGVSAGTADIIASAPGFIPDTITITGSLNLISLPTTLNVPYGANTSIAVTLGQPAPAGGVTVALVSSDSTLVSVVTPNVSIPQGASSANGTVYGVALGTVTVTASNANYASDQSAISTTATLNIVNTSQTIHSTIPIAQTLEFRSAGALIAAPAGGIVAALASLDTTCVTVPATATITAGLSSTTFTPTYGGTAPLACTTEVLVTYPGVGPDSISITVNPPPGTTIYAADVGSGLATNGQVYLAIGVPTARNVVVRSLDPTKILVANADTAVGADSAVFAFAPGGSFTYYYIRGREGFVNDSALVQVDVPGFTSSQAWVRVRQPGVVAGGVPGTTTTLSAPTAISANIGLPNIGNTSIQTYQPARPGSTLATTFTFTVTPSAVATLMKADSVQDTVRTAALVAGQYYTGTLAQGGVQYVPVGPGSSTVTVTGSGFVTLPQATATTVISAPTTTIYAADVGSGLATNGQVYLQTGVPSPRNVVVRSLDTTKVLVAIADTAVGGDSAVFAFPLNGSFTYYYIRGKEGVVNDSALVEVSVLGYSSSQAWVRVRAPAVVVGGVPGTTTTFSAPTAISANIGLPNVGNTSIQAYQRPRPGGTLNQTFTFTVVPSTVATLMKADSVQDTVRTATLLAGQYYTGNLAQGGVQYVPIGPGSSTVTVTGSEYLALPQATATTTVSAPTTTIYAADVGSGLATSGQVYLQTGVPTARNVVVRSLDTTKVLVATADTAIGRDSAIFAFPTNGSFTYYYIRGKEGVVNDSALVEVSVLGYSPSQAWVRVRQPGIVLSGVPTTPTTQSDSVPFAAYIGLPNLGNTSISAYQPIRPGGVPLTALFKVSTPGVGRLATSGGQVDSIFGSILVGQYNTPTSVAGGGQAFTSLTTGVDTVTVASPGYIALPQAIQVVTISTPGITVYSPGNVGAGLQGTGQIYLGANRHGGVWVKFESSNPSVALVARNDSTPGVAKDSVFLADGQTFTYFWVQGVDSASGTPILTVSANGFVDATTSVTVVQPGIIIGSVPASMSSTAADAIIYGYVGVPNAGNTGLNAYQSRRPGVPPLVATFTTTDPAAATLVNSGGTGATRTATIDFKSYNTPGSVASGGVALRPVAVGSAQIAVASPGFIPQTTASASVNVTP